MATTRNNNEIGFSEIWRTLSRQYRLVIAVTVVATAATALFAFTRPDEYEADGTLEVGRILEIPLEAPTTVANRMASRSFLAMIGKKVGWTLTPSEIQEKVDVESVFAESRDRPLTRAILVRVRGDDAAGCAAFARAMMAAVVEEHRVTYKKSWDVNYEYLRKIEGGLVSVNESIARGRADIERLAKTGAISQVQMSYLANYVEEKESYALHLEEQALELRQQLFMETYSQPTRVTVEPITPRQPIGPHRIRIIIIAFLISLALSIVVAFAFDQGVGRRREATVAARPAAKKKTEPLKVFRANARPTANVAAEERILSERSDFSLTEFFGLLRSQRWIIVGSLVCGVALGVLYSFVRPRQYKADFVLSVGVVGESWLHNPLLTQEWCASKWFLDKLSASVGRKYDAYELENMVEAEIIQTPAKGLTRKTKITVTADTPDDCYALATNLGKLLAEADREDYEKTLAIYEGYLEDLTNVTAGVAAGVAGEAGRKALEPNIVVIPPEKNTEYPGGGPLFPLFARKKRAEENPFLVASVALLEQVYVDTYLRARSPVYSQPTRVEIPPLKPTKPEGPRSAVVVLIISFLSFIIGMTIAALNYRLRQAKAAA